MNACWVDGLLCRPPESNVCDREGDFCYRQYRTMSAGCITMRWAPPEPAELEPASLREQPAPIS